MTPGADDVLEALDPEHREVASAVHGPVCVLAGAGTGKTRAITHRIAYGVHSGVMDPRSVLAVTFTARAAGEMRERLGALGVPTVAARTFHSAALRQLQYFWPRAVGGEPWPIIERKLALVAEAAGRVRVGVDRTILRDLAAEIEWAKVTQVAPDDYVRAVTASGRPPAAGLDAATTAGLLSAYEEVKSERRVIDFEDVLLMTAAILDSDDGVAEQVRSQYRHFTVDEYQDVSPLQQRLLDLWLGGRDSLCVVGDPSQTIYTFTGATPSFLLGFQQRYPDASVVRLVRDYRSTPQVVAVANGLLKPARGAAARQRLELLAQRPAGPAPRFVEFSDEPAEAAGAVAAIAALIAGGVPAAEVAVLFRTNGQSEGYEQALADAGIPYLVRGGARFFERPEIREAIRLLRGAAVASADPGDLGADTRAVLAGVGWSTEPPRGSDSGAVRQRWESLSALVRIADDLAASAPGAGLRDLVSRLAERAAAQHVPTVDGVTLATLHAAKGLEWDAVFLVGVSEGLLPIAMAEGDEAVEEERRLLYVGVTRAREHLTVSWAAARSPGSRASRSPSRFLDGVRPPGSSASDSPAPARGPSGNRRSASGPAHCLACGRALLTAAERKLRRCAQCPVDVDEELMDRLKSWRLETSKEGKVPAYVVFTDATLTAIAMSRPASRSALLEIPGIGGAKLERYGDAVLALCSGAVADPSR